MKSSGNGGMKSNKSSKMSSDEGMVTSLPTSSSMPGAPTASPTIAEGMGTVAPSDAPSDAPSASLSSQENTTPNTMGAPAAHDDKTLDGFFATQQQGQDDSTAWSYSSTSFIGGMAAACAMTIVASAAFFGRKVLWTRGKTQNATKAGSGCLLYDNLSLSTSSSGGDSAIDTIARTSQEQQHDEETTDLGQV
jgi:hypothetical protein